MTLILVSIHVEKSPPAFPLASAILKTSLKNDDRTAKIDVRLAEYYLPVEALKTAAELIRTGATAIGFSAATWNAAEVIAVAKEIKKINLETLVFVGGPQATASAESFSSTGFFDFILRGEGECIADIIAPFLFGKKNPPPSGIINSNPASFETGQSPFPAFFNEKKRTEGLLWEISRGCPYSCSFCYESRGNKNIRTISDERLKMELGIFREQGIEKIWVLDPTFNFNRKHAEKVLELILEHYPDPHYTFEIRAELMSEKLCKLFSGLDASLQIGLQTTKPESLKNINRSLNKEKFLDKCRMMSKYGLSFGIDLIYGLPGDNYSSFRESLDYAASAAPNNIDIFPLSVLPGTEISDKAEEYGIIQNGFPSFETIHNSSFTVSDMIKAAKLTEACDLLYNKEQAFAWFNTVTQALEISPSKLLEQFSVHGKKTDIPGFILSELRRQRKNNLIPVIGSFMNWSRTAEAAFNSPGRAFKIKLSHKPELLDKLTTMTAEEFIKRHPQIKERSYEIYFDGEELFIN